jgi:hypothetical protein
MTDISYAIGLIIGYLIPILIVALIASFVLRMFLEKVNGVKIRYFKAFLPIFIAYLISFVIGGNLGEIMGVKGFSRVLLICLFYLSSIAIIFYFFLELNGKKLMRKDLVIHSSIQTLTVFVILTLLLIIVS